MKSAWMMAGVVVLGCAQLPQPTGESSIGTRSWVATHDASVVDVLANEPGSAVRRLPVRAYYPVTEGAPPQPTGGPVLVFVHGTMGEIDAHRLLAEDLASHGWVVLLAAYPGLARSVDYPDAPSRGMSLKLHSVTREEADLSALSAAYAEPFMKEAVALLQQDVRLVLASAASEFPGVSFDRVAYGGHSMGATVTMGVCRDESSKCIAFVNLDGTPLADIAEVDGAARVVPLPVGHPTLVLTSELMETGDRTGPIWRLLDEQAEKEPSPLLRLRLLGAGHVDLTDAPVALGRILQGLLFGEGAAGPIDPLRAVEVTRLAVREFLGRFGRCDPSIALPGVLAETAELRVQRTQALDRGCR